MGGLRYVYWRPLFIIKFDMTHMIPASGGPLSSDDHTPSVADYLDRLQMNDPSLVSLDLSSITITEEQLDLLSQVLTENSTLKSLCLDEVGHLKRLRTFCHTLASNTTLTMLTIGSSYIDGERIDYISRALTTNSTLTVLSLPSNCISDKGAESLSQSLEINCTLRTLSLFDNFIGVKGFSRLGQALTINSTLSHLNIWGYAQDPRAFEGIVEALNLNHSLTKLDVNFGFSSKPAQFSDCLQRNKINLQLRSCTLFSLSLSLLEQELRLSW